MRRPAPPSEFKSKESREVHLVKSRRVGIFEEHVGSPPLQRLLSSPASERQGQIRPPCFSFNIRFANHRSVTFRFGFSASFQSSRCFRHYAGPSAKAPKPPRGTGHHDLSPEPHPGGKPRAPCSCGVVRSGPPPAWKGQATPSLASPIHGPIELS